jgi:multisubunit Na+/H+ antiporter MnhF subunit
MNDGFLYGTHWFTLQCAFFMLMLVAAEVAFRLGRNSKASTRVETTSPVSTVVAALLGVLALLLGFTISMAVSRFEVRKQLVLDEANAIQTSCLRARLLPAPEGPRDRESSAQPFLSALFKIRGAEKKPRNILLRVESVE